MRIATQIQAAKSKTTEPDADQAGGLVVLAGNIADSGDRASLDRMHRCTFIYSDNRYICIAEFIEHLAASRLARKWCHDDQLTVDMAYDLTISKFSNIPGGTVKSDGPDCRYYYRAFAEHAKDKIKPDTGIVEAQLQAAELLKKFIVRHFHLSCLECVRKAQKTAKRFIWQAKGKAVTIWMPAEMSAKLCRKWLDENIGDLDLFAPGGTDRIQELVHKLLAQPRIETLSDAAMAVADTAVLNEMIRSEISICGLGEYVAQEKSSNLDNQRPAIAALGTDTLASLVKKIFEQLGDENYDLKKLAGEFGVSHATLSRFAGSRWIDEKGDFENIPDLWANTARVLARHSDFMELAKAAGIFGTIEKINARGGTRKGSHGK
jgi:hypothetical protein